MSGLMQWNEDGQVREMTKDGTRPDGDCRKTTIRFLAGSGVTDAGGNWSLNVADAVCEQVGLVGAVSFVATATYDPRIDSLPRPSYIMTANTHSGGYVTLFARSFDCRCELLPDVPFDYHVAISYDFVG
ncbi:MAG TPA: hypothetical protein VGO40_00325 [Longimicrobium sp.]|jgi:hypothetical protein|nr:hypothetical protein [Longimicrobium sp.]